MFLYIWQRELSQSTVSAPRRLLQFAVRDAVATSRPSGATAEPSLKRLRSVVSTSTGDSFLEERPHRVRRTMSSAAIKAVAEAIKDVNKVRSSRNVFDRLGRITDVPETTHDREYEDVAEDLVGEDFTVEMENFHSPYDLHNDSSRLQERNMSSFHDTVMDSDLVYDEEDYDDIDARGREATGISRSGTSGGNWVGNYSTFEHGAAESVDERLHRPHMDLGQSATLHNRSLRIASTVNMTTRKPQYHEEEREGYQRDDKIVQGSDTVTTKSEEWLMKENSNPITAFNGNVRTI